MSPKILQMRKRRMVGVPSTAPEDEEEKTPQPRERGVVQRRRVSPEQYLGGSTSTATELLEKVVGKPPEKIKEPVDAVTLSKL